MEKSIFLETANNLYEEAVSATSYWLVIQQFRKNTDEYYDEMHCSSAFYNIVYKALLDGLFMCLSKLYDWDSRSITLRTLINELDSIGENDLDPQVYKKYSFCGNTVQHLLTPSEECFFQKEVQDTKRILEALGVDYHHTSVDLSLSELLLLYRKRFESIKEQGLIRNLIKQRNKIHAHNDAETNFDYESVWTNYPLTDADIRTLIDFAVEFLQCCIELLAGIYKVAEYVNINDWEASLRLVRVGKKYLDTYINDSLSENS